MKRVAGLMVLGTLFLANQARADDSDRALKLMLYAHHGVATPATLAQIAPDARARLLNLFDGSKSAIERDRILLVLAQYGGRDVEERIVRVLFDPRTADRRKHALIFAYAKGFGSGAVANLEKLGNRSRAIEQTVRAALNSN